MTAPSPAASGISAPPAPDSDDRTDHLRLRDLWHRYDGAAQGAWTLRGIDLRLAPGELVGLLGPSGCGKTTLLRLIAGFERPARGEVLIDGRLVAGSGRWLEPERRGVGMVFQDYALFPHLDAWRNACFGLRRGQDPARAAWLLELLGLGGLERRYPHELSGGQRQRLALARALAPGPALVLLDEPFSNLDVEVRLRLRSDLREVLARCGAGGLLVTHDPEEALAICDRVGVLRDGLLHQCAAPRDLVANPATAFVGSFLLQANLLPATRRGDQIETPMGRLAFAAESADAAADATGDATGTGLTTTNATAGDARGTTGDTARLTGDPAAPVDGALEVMVGDHDLEFCPDPAGDAHVCGREFLGRDWRYRFRCGDRALTLRLPLEVDLAGGLRGRLRLRPGQPARLFPGGHPLVAL